MKIKKRILFNITFILISIIVMIGESKSVNNIDCLKLEYVSTERYNLSIDSLAFSYIIYDSCRSTVIDTILISGGIYISQDGLMYGTNCINDSCALIQLKFIESDYRIDTLFMWDYTTKQIPNLYLSQFVFSPFDSLFIFEVFHINKNGDNYDSYITKIKSRTNLDTLKILPFTKNASFSNDYKQIFFESIKHIKDSLEPHNDIIVYDLETNESYNPLPSNKLNVYHPKRINKHSYIYFKKFSQGSGYNVFRISEGVNEEQLTFIGKEYSLVDFTPLNDTSLVYWVEYEINSKLFIEERVLYLNHK